MSADDTIRLAKRVAELKACSRREAELYIEGGYVLVDGAVVEDQGARVTPGQTVELAEDATLLDIVPVTLLLNKPAGVDPLSCLTAENRSAQAGKERFLKRHVAKLQAMLPLHDAASGLFVFTQDYRVARKLVDDATKIEHEIIVDVTGAIADDGLKRLNNGWAKVSWQNEGRLRFAIKNPQPGRIEAACAEVGLTVTALKRLRIGRISMGALPVGQWRYLQGYERF
jgi:23S rRNA pseudouridine2604 synthase